MEGVPPKTRPVPPSTNEVFIEGVNEWIDHYDDYSPDECIDMGYTLLESEELSNPQRLEVLILLAAVVHVLDWDKADDLRQAAANLYSQILKEQPIDMAARQLHSEDLGDQLTELDEFLDFAWSKGNGGERAALERHQHRDPIKQEDVRVLNRPSKYPCAGAQNIRGRPTATRGQDNMSPDADHTSSSRSPLVVGFASSIVASVARQKAQSDLRKPLAGSCSYGKCLSTWRRSVPASAHLPHSIEHQPNQRGTPICRRVPSQFGYQSSLASPTLKPGSTSAYEEFPFDLRPYSPLQSSQATDSELFRGRPLSRETSPYRAISLAMPVRPASAPHPNSPASYHVRQWRQTAIELQARVLRRDATITDLEHQLRVMTEERDSAQARFMNLKDSFEGAITRSETIVTQQQQRIYAMAADNNRLQRRVDELESLRLKLRE